MNARYGEIGYFGTFSFGKSMMDKIDIFIFDNIHIMNEIAQKKRKEYGYEEVPCKGMTFPYILDDGSLNFEIFILDKVDTYWTGLAHEFQHVLEIFREERKELCTDEEYIPELAGGFFGAYIDWHFNKVIEALIDKEER
jgi:hypothetical protein